MGEVCKGMAEPDSVFLIPGSRGEKKSKSDLGLNLVSYPVNLSLPDFFFCGSVKRSGNVTEKDIAY